MTLSNSETFFSTSNLSPFLASSWNVGTTEDSCLMSKWLVHEGTGTNQTYNREMLQNWAINNFLRRN